MADDRSVLAIFVDVRGFTRWSEANEVFINLERFVQGFLEILRRRFREPDFSLKPLGDGALIVSELDEIELPRDASLLLSRVLKTVKAVETDFARHCEAFSRRVGHGADLKLGWGVVRGKVIKVRDDWAGHNLNKCSRLCGEARPFGVVIDRHDFPELPKEALGFTAQVRRLRGVGDVPVWVSSQIASQFVPRERLRETPEVHVAGTCFSEDGSGRIKVLFARRSQERQLFPGKLEGCGGQLRFSESFVEGVRRHFRSELGLDVEVLADFHKFYEIREPNHPVIPGIRFLCRLVGDGEPVSLNHSEFAWLTERELARQPSDDFVGDLRHEMIDLLKAYRQSRAHRSS